MSRFTYDDLGYSLRQRREDEEPDRYRDLCEAEDERRRREHEAEFDFPYVSDGKQIEEVIKQQAKAKRAALA